MEQINQQELDQKLLQINQKILKFQQEMNHRLLQFQQELNHKMLLFQQELHDELQSLKTEKSELKTGNEEHEVLANKLTKDQKGGKRIKLDIGGQIFVTSLSTLTSHKGSFFEAMFSGRWEPTPEDDGCYFIDRDPTVFKNVLNYLRGQLPTLDTLSQKEVQQLKEDAEFYHLTGLSDYLNSLSAPVKYKFVSGPNYTVSSDGLQITKTSTGTQHQWDVTAITNPIPSSGLHSLNLKIVYSEFGSIIVGVCPSSINPSEPDVYLKCGWYFYCNSGSLYSGPPQSANNKSYFPNPAIGTGREVGVKMDMTNRQISFTVDGVDRGVAFTDVPVNQTLCFCVLLAIPGESVRIAE